MSVKSKGTVKKSAGLKKVQLSGRDTTLLASLAQSANVSKQLKEALIVKANFKPQAAAVASSLIKVEVKKAQKKTVAIKIAKDLTAWVALTSVKKSA